MKRDLIVEILKGVYEITQSDNKNITAYRIAKLRNLNVSSVYKKLEEIGHS